VRARFRCCASWQWFANPGRASETSGLKKPQRGGGLRAAYGRPAPRVKGLRIQINSQHTGTVAESYLATWLSAARCNSTMILLTGGTGFVGSHVLERLRADGAPVRCLVRPKREERWMRVLWAQPKLWRATWRRGAGLKRLWRCGNGDPPGGDHQGVAAEEYYDGNVRATRIFCWPWRGAARGWCT